jgi:hypothetical protein
LVFSSHICSLILFAGEERPGPCTGLPTAAH